LHGFTFSFKAVSCEFESLWMRIERGDLSGVVQHVSCVGMIGHLPAEEPDNEAEKILRESWLQILKALL